MDQSAFYGVVSAINFTLLGLWWVAVKDRAGWDGDTALSHRTAYLVSLQFVIPGTVSLLAQVAPDVPTVWRAAFALAGVVGAVGIVMLSDEVRRTSDLRLAPTLFRLFGVPLYVLVALVAVVPLPASFDLGLAPIQIEALLLSLLVFLGVQEAWVVSMTPPGGSRAQD
jgi:cytochrome bd-type quinol oxidase subunit 2